MGLFGNNKKTREESQRELEEARKKWKENGGWGGLFNTFQEAYKKDTENLEAKSAEEEEKKFPERVKWRETLNKFISNPKLLDDLTDSELEDHKITAQNELKRFQEAGEWSSGQDLNLIGMGILMSGKISASEVPILTTLIERNEKLIAFINARQENRKNRPPQLPDKQEQNKKREEQLINQLAEFKEKRVQMIKIETGGKPFDECSSEEQRNVKQWENTFDEKEKQIREELNKIWKIV